MHRIYITLICIGPVVALHAADNPATKPIVAHNNTDYSLQIVSSNDERPITLLDPAKEHQWKAACSLMTQNDPKALTLHILTSHIMQHQLHNSCYYFLEVQKKHACIEDFETLLEYGIKHFVPIQTLQALLHSGASSSAGYNLVYHDNEKNRTFTLVRQVPIFLAMWHGNIPAFKELYNPSTTARLIHFTPEKKEDETAHEPFGKLAGTMHSVVELLEYMRTQKDSEKISWPAKASDVQQMIDHVQQAGARSCCLA